MKKCVQLLGVTVVTAVFGSSAFAGEYQVVGIPTFSQVSASCQSSATSVGFNMIPVTDEDHDPGDQSMRTSATLVSYQWVPDGENDAPVTFHFKRNFTVEVQLQVSSTSPTAVGNAKAESLPGTGANYSITAPPSAAFNLPTSSYTDELMGTNAAQTAGQMQIITGAKASTSAYSYFGGSASGSSSIKVQTTSITLVNGV